MVLTNDDIKKLKEVFATKEDLQKFATKDYIDGALKNQSTELANVMRDIFLTQDRIFVSREEFLELKNRVERIKGKIDL